MVEISEKFFIWGYHNEMSKEVIQVVCKTGMVCKKDILNIFVKFIRKHLCWSLSLIWHCRDSSAGVFLRILQKLKNTYFAENLRTVTFETLHD